MEHIVIENWSWTLGLLHPCPEYDQEWEYMMILNQKKVKADLIIFKCLQGTNIPNFTPYGERVCHNNGTRGNNATLNVPRVRTEAELPIDIQNVGYIVTLKHRLKEHLRGLN